MVTFTCTDDTVEIDGEGTPYDLHKSVVFIAVSAASQIEHDTGGKVTMKEALKKIASTLETVSEDVSRFTPKATIKATKGGRVQ